MSKYSHGDQRPYSFYPGDLVEISLDKYKPDYKPFWWHKNGQIGIVIESYWHDDWNFNHHMQIFLQEDERYYYIDTNLVKKL